MARGAMMPYQVMATQETSLAPRRMQPGEPRASRDIGRFPG